jgi:hypothetical protein
VGCSYFFCLSQVAIGFTVFGMQMHRAGSQHGAPDVTLIAADE